MPIATLNFNYVDKRTINYIYENCLCFTALDDNLVLSITKGENHNAEITKQNYNFYYSLDNGYTWSEVQFIYNADEDPEEETISIPAISNGKKILIRGYNNTTLEGITFLTTKNFNVSGNIMTLLDYDTALTKNSIPEYCFYKLFRSQRIVDASKLILPDFVSIGAYNETFENCKRLTATPELPATTLADYCYGYMFNGCTSLATTPALTATTLANFCYASMFRGCTSLATAPALPAITLAHGCYESMFRGCTSMTIGPGLPATTLANSCYELMFSGCTALVQPPALPATTLSDRCYRYMFSGCTSMTYAPHLPADYIPNLAYAYMFSGCTSLNYINIHATQRESNSLNNWVNNVAPTGTFVKHPTATYDIDSVNGVPIGWTIYSEGDYIPQTYTITITKNEDWGNVYGAGTYVAGATVTIQAYPNAGYKFVGWDHEGHITSKNPMQFPAEEDMNLIAVFEEDVELPDYTVTLYCIPSSITGWTLYGEGEWKQGTFIDIRCVNTGNTTQTFDGWYVRDSNYNYTLITSEQEFSIQVTENIEYYALFKDIVPEYYYIYAGLDPRSGGMGNTTGSGDYVRGDTCTLQAYPLEGYNFIYWTIDGERTSLSNPISVYVDKSHQYLAYIKPITPIHNMIIENNAMWASEIKVSVNDDIIDGIDLDEYDGSTHDPKQWIYRSIDEGSNIVVNAIKYNDYIDFDGWWTKDEHGTFIKLSDNEQYSFIMQDELYLYCKWKIHEEINEIDYSKEYFTITALQDNTDIYADIIIGTNVTGPSYTIEASINNGEFVEHLITRASDDYSFDRKICTLNNGDNVRLRAIMPWDWSDGDKHYIVKDLKIYPTKLAKISGNLLSLVAGVGFLNSNLLSSNYISFPFVFNKNIFDARYVWFPYLEDITQNTHYADAISYYDNYYNTHYSYNDGRFSHMLANNSYMLACPKTLGEQVEYYSYSFLLKNCYNISDSPICPATTLAEGCYARMFEDCRKLINGANLMADVCTEGCYVYMYNGCTNLQNPGILNASILAQDCYNSMYQGCTSLQTAPLLKAESMVNGCYNNMFWGCKMLNFIEIDLKYKTLSGQWGMYNMFTYEENSYPDGRLYKDPSVSWMTREYLNSEGTNVPDNWTFEDIE